MKNRFLDFFTKRFPFFSLFFVFFEWRENAFEVFLLIYFLFYSLCCSFFLHIKWHNGFNNHLRQQNLLTFWMFLTGTLGHFSKILSYFRSFWAKQTQRATNRQFWTILQSCANNTFIVFPEIFRVFPRDPASTTNKQKPPHSLS